MYGNSDTMILLWSWPTRTHAVHKRLLATCVLLFIATTAVGIWFIWQPDETPHLNSAGSNLPEVEPDATEPLADDGRKAPSKEENRAPVEEVVAGEPVEKTTDPSVESPEVSKLAAVTGRVVNAITGRPITDATASVRYRRNEEIFRESADVDAEGRFRILLSDLTAVPPDATVTAWSGDYDTPEDQPVVAGENLIRLLPATSVVVRIDNPDCVSEAAWIRWEDDDNSEHYGESFERSDGKACIIIEDLTEARDARVYANWFGIVLESEVLRIEPNQRHEISLTPPAGGVLTVKVIGPDGRALRNAIVEVRDHDWRDATAKTGEYGEVVIHDVAVGERLEVDLRRVEESFICVARREVMFQNVGDRVDVLFDLTNTGIVDCFLTINGKLPSAIVLPEKDEGLPIRNEVLRPHKDATPETPQRIYGLEPGKYVVEVHDRNSEQEFSAEFEVQPPPTVSKWRQDFRSYTLTVRVRGWTGTDGMIVRYFNNWSRSLGEVGPDEDGNFVIENLGDEEIIVRASGGGYASQMVPVNPAKVSEVDVTVERSGSLRLSPLGTRQGYLTLRGPGDEGKELTLDLDETEAVVLELLPGTYAVSTFRFGAAPWGPVSVTVIAGEEVLCEYGPAFTSRLRVRVSERSSLWGYDVRLVQNGEDVPHEQMGAHMSDGEEVHELMFQAEGKLTLIVTGSRIEDFSVEFEVERGKSTTIEINLTRKK